MKLKNEIIKNGDIWHLQFDDLVISAKITNSIKFY